MSLLDKCGNEKLGKCTLLSISLEWLRGITGKDKDTPMREKHKEEAESKGILCDMLEEFTLQKNHQRLQDLWEQEVIEWVGIERGRCKANPAEKLGYDYGYGRAKVSY